MRSLSDTLHRRASFFALLALLAFSMRFATEGLYLVPTSGGGFQEICTSGGFVRIALPESELGEDPAAPSHDLSGKTHCPLCITPASLAILATPVFSFPPPLSVAIIPSAASSGVHPPPLDVSHVPRAPPTSFA
jgi:hypothetical protein